MPPKRTEKMISGLIHVLEIAAEGEIQIEGRAKRELVHEVNRISALENESPLKVIIGEKRNDSLLPNFFGIHFTRQLTLLRTSSVSLRQLARGSHSSCRQCSLFQRHL